MRLRLSGVLRLMRLLGRAPLPLWRRLVRLGLWLLLRLALWLPLGLALRLVRLLAAKIATRFRLELL